MAEVTVGARELKARLGSYLRIVRSGGTVTVTARGKVVGRIVPITSTHESVVERFRTLAQAGVISWDGNDPEPYEPVAQLRGDGTIAELLVEDRE